MHGLRIRQRIREQYGVAPAESGAGDDGIGSSPAAAKGGHDDEHDEEEGRGRAQLASAGGFLTGVEDVVQPYSLPRPTHAVFSSPPRSPNSSGRASPAPPAGPAAVPRRTPLASPSAADDDEDEDEDVGKDDAQPSPPFNGAVEDLIVKEELEWETEDNNIMKRESRKSRQRPKSMAALAAEQAAALVIEDAASAPRRTTTHAATKTKTKTWTQQASSRKRTRARAQEEEEEEEEDDDEDEASGPDGVSDNSKDGGGVGDGERPRRVARRARKLPRRERGGLRAGADVDGAVPPVPIPVQSSSSDRVLRARRGKSPGQLAREREQELAVNRALAG